MLSLACVALIGGLAYLWWPGEERIIRGRLDSLAETLADAPGDAGLAQVARVAGLAGYFAPDVRIRFGTQAIESREMLLGLMSRWTPPSGGFSVEFVDVTVTLQEPPQTAEVYLTAKLSSRDPRTGGPTVDAREALVTMRKLDGEWVIASVEGADTLQRP